MGDEGHCFGKYKCPDESHNRYKSGLHILVCDRHKNDEKNLHLLDLYKSKCISDTHKDFSKKIEIAVISMTQGPMKLSFKKFVARTVQKWQFTCCRPLRSGMIN